MKDIESRQLHKRLIPLSCVNVFIISSGFEPSLDIFCDSESKSLIKVLNKPLLAYQLEYFERQGIKEIFIITNKKYYQGVEDYISSQFIGEIKAEIIITNKENFDLFNVIKNKVTKSNFLLVSGDSIINFNLNTFIDNHILEHSLVSLILTEDTQKFYNQRFKFLSNKSIQVFGIEKTKTEKLHKIVYSCKKEQNDPFTLKKITLKHSSNFKLFYNLEDIHFYLFNSNLFNLDTEEMKQMTSINTDFIPFLIIQSFSNKLNTQLKEKANDNKLLVDQIKVKCHILSNDEYA